MADDVENRADDLEDRIRSKAYELWEADGRPHGRDVFHWDEAKEIIALKDAGDTALVPLKESARDTAEPATALENQGEFPDLADQGDTHAPNWAEASEVATPALIEPEVEQVSRRRTRSRTGR